jgi:hypothetical protein
MLKASKRKSRREDVRKKRTLKDLDRGGKMEDGMIRGAEVKGFTWFRNGKDVSRFPDRGEVSMVDRKIEEFGEKIDTLRTRMF